MRRAPVERVVLVGFMASGKSTVGALLARRLGWRHLDLDQEIEREAGCSVAEIFRERGEAGFREMEAEATRRVAALPRLVLTPGGGWVTNPSLLALLPPDTLTVWLHATAEEVLRRLRDGEGAPRRPLLEGPDPEGTVRRLLGEREPHYRRADRTVFTDGRSAEAIADEIERMVRGDAAPGH